MEMRCGIYKCKKLFSSIMLLMLATYCFAQQPVKAYSIKDGKMYIMLSKNLSAAAIDSFAVQFNLRDLDLKHFVQTGSMDSLVKLNWKLELNNGQLLAISKKLDGFGNFNNPADNISIAEDLKKTDSRFPVVSNNVRYGYNRFKTKPIFSFHDSIVNFSTNRYKNAQQVILSGSFVNWSENSIAMTKTDSGWTATLQLKPGKYWYKFIVDGNWQTDPDNLLVENDGQGNNNSVYYQPNYIFTSHSFSNAKKIYVAGSFNNWRDNELQMTKTSDGFKLPLYLADGTYTYRLIVDGNWQADPENPSRSPNEFNDFNSVIAIGNQFMIRLDGYTHANKVMLAGSFNNWKDNELPMTKTPTGWEINYHLGKGNHDYSFKVDNKWIAKNSTPTDEKFTSNFNNAIHYNLVLGANYTFHLKSFADAKTVFVAGDFNNWSPDGYAMKKVNNEWIFDANLTKGKHLYKFVVDGKWILDPGNKLWEQNEHNTGNSVIWIEQ